MIPDPTADIKRIRHQLGADDDFDLDRIFARLRKRQSDSGRTYIRRTPRTPRIPTDNQRMHRSGACESSKVENQTSPPGDA